ncbi:MAG: 2-amino-4-hydroxy-6-hydroxymethyldihydropteridine diphosphokinase [Bacteroidales bacterium]|nr:2-amino-4-hydroxy-6-hydroxymethyldihydropteridine diphosphokinase [Bacteroidales bacterium]
MSYVYLGLGSNMGDRVKNLTLAVSLINQHLGTVFAESGIYKSEPWGFESSNEFLNKVVGIRTNLDPEALLKSVLSIEDKMGRIREGEGYSDRIIDIDILLYDDLIVNEDHLVIPHSLMHERIFVLEPLTEIAPDLVHPLFLKSMSQLLADLSSTF